MPLGIRTAVMASLEMAGFATKHTARGAVRKVNCLRSVLEYAVCIYKRSPRRAKPVNIPELVAQWVEAVVGLSTAHDKDGFDAADGQTDALLGPVLTAPVKQLREFYAALRDALRADPRVPWAVWIGFEAWGDVMIKDARDEAVKRLKSKLAGEIADLCEIEAKEQLPEAIKRALRWRDPETLEKVKERLEAGEKPRLRGRESCLYLELGRGKKKVSVML